MSDVNLSYSLHNCTKEQRVVPIRVSYAEIGGARSGRGRNSLRTTRAGGEKKIFLNCTQVYHCVL